LTGEQPENNIVRGTIQTLAAVLGGVQSLHTGTRLGLQTQRVIDHESGVTRTADPFGGSYFLERLTLDMERQCREYFSRLDALGGMAAAIEKGFPQQEIRKAADQYRQAFDKKEKIVVGVNDFVVETQPAVAPAASTSGAQHSEKARDGAQVRSVLDQLRKTAALGRTNLMPSILDCVRAEATVSEILDELRTGFAAQTL
jgi:methylmalonyl-CoA mutase N-terminal domain/subunit